jgi:hypothetical protein
MLNFISVFSEQLNAQLSFICIISRSKRHGVDCRMHDRKTLGQALYMTNNYCINFAFLNIACGSGNQTKLIV